MNKKCLLAMIFVAFASFAITSNAQVVVFSNDFEDGDMTAEVGSMTLIADSATPAIVPVAGAPDATLGSNVLLLDQNVTALDLTLNLTDNLSLTGGNTVTIDFDVAARRTAGLSRTILVDAMDASGNIVTRFVLGDNNAFGNGGSDRQRPGFATIADGNMVFGTPPGSFWWGSDFNFDDFDANRDAHISLTIGESTFDFSTTNQGGVEFDVAGVSNYDAVASANIAQVRLTSLGVIYGAYFDNLVIAGVVDDTPVLLGDVNCDGSTDFLDIGPFITILSGGGAANAKADINLDGSVDFLDIAPFIAILSGG